jgi:hypothetical protein
MVDIFLLSLVVVSGCCFESVALLDAQPFSSCVVLCCGVLWEQQEEEKAIGLYRNARREHVMDDGPVVVWMCCRQCVVVIKASSVLAP